MYKWIWIVVWIFIGVTVSYYYPVIADKTIGRLKPR